MGRLTAVRERRFIRAFLRDRWWIWVMLGVIFSAVYTYLRRLHFQDNDPRDARILFISAVIILTLLVPPFALYRPWTFVVALMIMAVAGAAGLQLLYGQYWAFGWHRPGPRDLNALRALFVTSAIGVVTIHVGKIASWSIRKRRKR